MRCFHSTFIQQSCSEYVPHVHEWSGSMSSCRTVHIDLESEPVLGHLIASEFSRKQCQLRPVRNRLKIKIAKTFSRSYTRAPNLHFGKVTDRENQGLKDLKGVKHSSGHCKLSTQRKQGIPLYWTYIPYVYIDIHSYLYWSSPIAAFQPQCENSYE